MDKLNSEANQWTNSHLHIFWGEVAPCDHVLQIYENDKAFFDTLEGFAADGFIKEECVVIIATEPHLYILDERLRARGFNIDVLKRSSRYIPLIAEKCLAQFMVNNWPDEVLFHKFVKKILEQPVAAGKKIRAFGEMVAVLWSQGHNGATVQLEELWHRLQQQHKFCLFCAYPKSGFTQDAVSSIECICKAHSMTISGEILPSTQIYYKAV
jgi:hypothetical protein